ncbi:unnamed protein product, partial [Caretta caretta]
FKAVLCNRSYEGTVEFLTAGGTEANPRDQIALQGRFDLPFVSVHRVRALRLPPKQLEGSEERERPGCRGWKGLLRGLCWGEQPLSSWSHGGETPAPCRHQCQGAWAAHPPVCPGHRAEDGPGLGAAWSCVL